MKRKTQELLKSQCLQQHPEYSTEDLKEIAKQLALTKDEKAGKVYALLLSIDYEPFLFEDWCNNTNEEYDYQGLFYSTLEDIPLMIGDMTELDAIEDAVVKYRLFNHK